MYGEIPTDRKVTYVCKAVRLAKPEERRHVYTTYGVKDETPVFVAELERKHTRQKDEVGFDEIHFLQTTHPIVGNLYRLTIEMVPS